MNNHQLFVRSVTLLLLLIFINGCNYHPPSTYSITQTDIQPTSVIEFPTANSTISTTASTSTQKTNPDLSTSTIIPITNTPPVITPLPTLSPEEAKSVVLELIQDNDGCRFPCWWGIIPGTTSWADAQNFFEQFNQKIHTSIKTPQDIYAEISLPFSNEDKSTIYIYLDILVHDEIVNSIDAYNFENIPIYQLDKFLTLYGKPDEIWMHSYNYYLGNPPPIYLYLFYPNQGIMAYYVSNEMDMKQGIVNGCFSLSPSISLWDPNNHYTFSDMSTIFTTLGLKDLHLLPLKKATGMDIDTFYNEFNNPGNPPCMKTPMDIWPDP